MRESTKQYEIELEILEQEVLKQVDAFLWYCKYGEFKKVNPFPYLKAYNFGHEMNSSSLICNKCQKSFIEINLNKLHCVEKPTSLVPQYLKGP